MYVRMASTENHHTSVYDMGFNVRIVASIEANRFNVSGHFGYANDIISYRPGIIFIHFVNVQQLYYQFISKKMLWGQ